MSETHFHGEDMAHVIEQFKPELHEKFCDIYPNAFRYMNSIVNNPHHPVNLRTADAIVTAMGCPHVLANGAVRVVEHNRKQPVAEPPQVVPDVVPDILLPSAPFRKWMERQSRHYRTLTFMYQDFELGYDRGSGIWQGRIKQVHSPVVEFAAARRGDHIATIYPRFGII